MLPNLPTERPSEFRNFVLLALQIVVIRVGWIFKTESVIIPAFLDSIAGPGWMRGMLPVLNRLGQSVPAFLLAERMQAAPRKKRTLFVATLAMGLPFLVLALGVGLNGSVPLPALVFLGLYLLFWCFSGVNMVLSGTLQGKLIRATHRGRLIAASTFGSLLPAIGCAWWLLPPWLQAPVPRYDKIFGFTAVCFLLASMVSLMLEEPADTPGRRSALGEQVRGAFEILRRDGDYRRTVVVAALFSSAIMLFPHYQALARERLDLAGSHLMVWVVVQNLSMGVAALVVGPLADRYGNRLALRCLTFAAAGIPLLALCITRLETPAARLLFPLIFLAIGLIPIGFRVVTNYVLEISPERDHTRYLSLNQLCTAAAFLASPLLGLLIDVTSFELVFALGALLMLAGGAMTFRLPEPRQSGPRWLPRREPRHPGI